MLFKNYFFARFIKEEKGDLFVSMGYGIIILLIIFLTCFFAFPVYSKYQALHTEARQLVSVAENVGIIGQEVEEAKKKLENASGMVPDSMIWDANWHNATNKTIQLGDLFTLKLEKKHIIPIFTPAWSNKSYGFEVNLIATVTGISEVYFKP